MSSTDGIRNLSDLPDEILIPVFAYYLRGDDRKRARLSCRRFYDVCNCLLIQRNEQTVFYGNRHYTGVALQSLSNSRRKVWNIALHNLHFPATWVPEFFIQQGMHVHTLTLDCCAMGRGVLKRILESCMNLRELRLILGVLHHQSDPLPYREMLNDFQTLRNAGVCCESLTSFTLEVDSDKRMTRSWMYPTTGDLNAITAVLYNIKDLNLNLNLSSGFDNSDTGLGDDVALNQDGEGIISFIHAFLVSPSKQLEKLHLNWIIQDRSSVKKYDSLRILRMIANFETNNVKETFMNWLNAFHDMTYKNPFLLFKNVTHLDCCMTENESTDNSVFIYRFLNTVSELRTLILRTSNGFYLESRIFESLVRSQLVTLNFHFECSDKDNRTYFESFDTVLFKDFETFVLTDGLSPNLTLRHLRMSTKDDRLWLLFNKYFVSLNNLLVPDVKQEVLWNIFLVQRQLRNLTFLNSNKISGLSKYSALKEWLKNSESLVHHCLDYLTHLQIAEERSFALSELLLTEVSLPKLKSLKIEMNYLWSYYAPNNNFKTVLVAIKKLTQLEYLDIRCSFKISVDQWADLFSTLPKLKHVVFFTAESTLYTDAQYRYFFDVHPGLRSFCVTRSKYDNGEILHRSDIDYPFSGLVYYYRNILTNSVTEVDIKNVVYPSAILQDKPVFFT